jgi:hypothetical protein
MKKLNEFVDNKEMESKIIILLDRFLFFDGKWMFPDNIDYIRNILNNILDVNYFIKIGQDLSNKLNNENISQDDYNINMIELNMN